MRSILILFLLLAGGYTSLAQSAPFLISSPLLQVQEKRDSLSMQLSFKIQHPDSVYMIQVRLGKEKGTMHLLALDGMYLTEKGIAYFASATQTTEIINGVVFIRFNMAPVNQKKAFLEIHVQNKAYKEIYTFSSEVDIQ